MFSFNYRFEKEGLHHSYGQLKSLIKFLFINSKLFPYYFSKMVVQKSMFDTEFPQFF